MKENKRKTEKNQAQSEIFIGSKANTDNIHKPIENLQQISRDR